MSAPSIVRSTPVEVCGCHLEPRHICPDLPKPAGVAVPSERVVSVEGATTTIVYRTRAGYLDLDAAMPGTYRPACDVCGGPADTCGGCGGVR